MTCCVAGRGRKPAGPTIRARSRWTPSRSARRTTSRPATTGKDAGKKVPGRKRGLAVDALGLIIAVIVTAASVTDNQVGIRLLDKVAQHTPTVTHAWVDAGFKHDLALHA